MPERATNKKENKAEVTDRIARSIINTERNHLRKKSDRLRQMRLEAERMANE